MRVELWYGNFKKDSVPIKFRWEVEVWKKIFHMRARCDGYELNYYIYLVHTPRPTSAFLNKDHSTKWFSAILKQKKKEEEDGDKS